MSELHLIAQIADQRVAIPTSSVESVVEIDAIAPVPAAPPHIAGLSALRSRVITMIDSHAAIGLPTPPRPPIAWQAIVVTIEGHLYGLIVDGIEDVVTITAEPRPVRGAMAAGWFTVSRGMSDYEGGAILHVDPAAIVEGPMVATA